MQRKHEQIFWWLAAASFLVPFIVIPGSFIFPFIVPKALAFRTLVLCQLGVFLSAYYAKNSWVRLKLSSISWAVLAFGISFALSTFLGTDAHHSLWDNHERMLGLFTVLHYILYFFMLSAMISKDNWHKLYSVFLGAGSIVMILAIFQKIDPMFLLNNNNGRVSATLGNAIYLGAYGMFLFFSGVYLFTQNKKWWNLVASTLGIIGIIISGTRGSVLGVVAGLGTMLLVYFFTLPKEHSQARKWLGIVAISLTCLAGLLFAFRKTPTIQSLPAVGSLLNTTVSGSTASTRLMAWKIAVEAWQEKPIVGWGPNNFFYAFNKYYNPDFLLFGWGETWFDNAHNIILNTLATQGILGAITYLSLFAVSAYLLIQAARQKKISYHLAAVGTAFLAGHLVQNIFVFENITSYLYFFFFLAFVNVQTMASLTTHESDNRPIFSGGTKGIMWAIIILLIFTTDINPARANMSMIDTLQSLYKSNEIIPAYKKTAAIASPHQTDNRLDFARTITQAAETYVYHGKQAEYQPLVKFAIEELDKNRQEHPYDIRNHVQEAQLLQISFDTFKNTEDLLKAKEILLEAKTKSPDRQQIDYMLSGIELMLGEKNSAVDRMRVSVERSPTVPEGWWRLIYSLKISGDVEGAKAKAREARAKGIVFDATGESIVGPLAPRATSTQ